MCLGPQDVASTTEECFLLMHSLSTEADLAQGAIMGHPWEEDLFILSGVKGHFQHGKSQAFDSEEVGYPKYEILQNINNCI